VELCDLPAARLSEMLAAREVSTREAVTSALARITAFESQINSFITLFEEPALEQADSVDRRRSVGDQLPALAGIPVAIKDNICLAGYPTTCGSRMLYNFVAPYDATAVSKLKAQQVIPVGKTNMDEFGMGSSTEHSHFGATRNPWDLERVAGGSSGGSAAAVSIGACTFALGTDTGGSVRLPASLCGIVGLKPTYGRVSRYGLVAYASSLDQIGVLARTATDCALALEIIAGFDHRDSTSSFNGVPAYSELIDRDVRGMKIGIPHEYFVEGIDPEIESTIRSAIRHLEGIGMESRSISLPHTPYAIPTYYLIATAEASSNLARYDGVRYGYRAPCPEGLLDMYLKTRSDGFGREVKRRIMLGTYALSTGYYEAYYLRAQKVRTLIKRDYDTAFENVDCIVAPTSPTVAFRLGEKLEDPLAMYLSDIYTVSINLATIPAISIPCGLTHDGLPIGIQIIGRPFDEATVLRVAYALEQALHLKFRPPLIEHAGT
jgi:aspartyl-tRNA(Asn)/glutamyl-tRNA(Gln) amidotransferase subunit A